MSNNEDPYDVEKENIPPAENKISPAVEENPSKETAPDETASDEAIAEEHIEPYDPAVTPASSREKKKLSTGWFVTGVILLIVVALGIVAFVVSSVNNMNESRDVITGINLDSMGLSVVEDSINGDHFLVSGQDTASGTTYYAHCELEKYNLDDTDKGLVFCENSFLTEVNLDGEN